MLRAAMMSEVSDVLTETLESGLCRVYLESGLSRI